MADLKKSVIKMAALGRQLQLGGLYDYVNDRTPKNSLEWKSMGLSESVKTEFKIKAIPTESDSHKWEQMGLDEHLTASTLVGLVDKFRGASSYLDDKSNPGQVSHTVVIRIKTKKEDLSYFFNHFGDGSNLHIKQEATLDSKKGKSDDKSEDFHVIIGVVYGAEIYCVLTQDLADETDEDAREEAKCNLVDWAEQMGSALEENQDLTEFKEQFEKEEKHQLTRMKCRLYMDTLTPSFRECGFFDAYKHCLKLIEQTRKIDGKGKMVPITYKLCPLKIIMDPSETTKNPRKNHEVDADLMARCCSIWSQLENIIVRATSLSSSAMKVNRIPLRQFISYLEKYQELMRKRMKKGVIQSRTRTEDEDNPDQEFENVVNIVENHLNFKPTRLVKWLYYKSAEIEMTKEMTKLKDITFVATTDQLRNQLAESFDKKYALVLQVPQLDEKTNEILTKMEHIKYDRKLAPVNQENDDEDEINDEDVDDDELPWHMIQSKKKQVMDKMREFSNHVARNQDAENQIQFFIALNDQKKGFGCLFSIYENDKIFKDNIQLPSPPTGLQVRPETADENTKNVKIRLEWKCKDLDYPHLFLVEYRSKNSSDSWAQQDTTKVGQKQVIISCKRESMLEFRVATTSCIGKSNFSKVVDTESASVDETEDFDDCKASVSSASSSQSTLVTSTPQKNKGRINISELIGSETSLNNNEACLSPNSIEVKRTAVSGKSKSNSMENFPHSLRNKCKKLDKRNGMEIYQVLLKQQSRNKSDDKVVKRFVFGKNGPITGQHKTILVMGATGSGKTTLINGMINYIFGVEWEHPFRFQLIKEQLVGRSQAQSQTSVITAYDIHHMDGFRIPYSLTIVDTPGYGDTKGLERDQEITEMVRKFFEDKNGIQTLDVVGFVAQASLPRLTPTQIYIFDSVLSIFGKDVKENINFLLTFADSQKPPVLSAIKAADLPCPKNSDGDPFHNKFNNSGFFCSNQESSSGGAFDKFNRFFWKMGLDNFQKFFSSVTMMTPKSLSLTKQVLDERKKLEATVDGLQPLIKFGLAKMEELRKIKQMISNSQAQIEANEDVTIEVEVTLPKKVEIAKGQHLTNCNKCYMTCHFPCGIPNDDGKKGCWAMDARGNCRICPEKCVWNMHANQPYKWEYVKEKQVTSSEAIKQKYESELNRKLNANDLVTLMEEEIKENEQKVLERVDTVANCIKRLDEIALRPNPFSTPQYIDLIIDSEEQEKKPGFKERIESLKRLRQMAVITNKVRNKESLFERQYNDNQQYDDHILDADDDDGDDQAIDTDDDEDNSD